MKEKILSIVLSLVLLISIVPVALAETELPMVIDAADLLSEAEESGLEQAALELRSKYFMDIVILTVQSLDGASAQNYADNYYDLGGYGYGENGDGILFLLAMDEREWYISTCGEAIYAVTDYGVQQLGSAALPYLSDGLYFDAFNTYLNELSFFLEAYALADPLDGYADYSGDFYHGTREEILYYEEEEDINFFLSLGSGIVAAGIVILIMRSSMNTKRRQQSASDYMNEGSYHLRVQRDMFLYSNVSKTRKQQSNSSGGGSSVHRSSGDRRHGGGGGRF